MWTNEQLKEKARVNLNRNYWPLVLAGLLYSLAAGGVSTATSSSSVRSSIQNAGSFGAMIMAIVLTILAVSTLFSIALDICVFNPLMVGVNKYFVACQTQEKPELNTFAFGFKNCYGKIVLTMFLQDLFIFLWSLLFIIPGIYKSLEWMLVPYILTENPGMDAKEARQRSAELMDGNKWKAFVLGLSFLGWVLLSVITCGIVGIFYVTPYMQLTYGELYTAIKAEKQSVVNW